MFHMFHMFHNMKQDRNPRVDVTPKSLYNTFYASDKSAQQQHLEWMDEIRNKIWERCTFENQLPPSNDALGLHWQRCCWVIDYWSQASMSYIIPLPITLYGWAIDNNTISVIWDSPENLQSIRNHVAFLTHGCSCQTGCQTLRCRCVKSSHPCGPGCSCGENCTNKHYEPPAGAQHTCTCTYSHTIHPHTHIIYNTTCTCIILNLSHYRANQLSLTGTTLPIH